MTRLELDSLHVVRAKDGRRVEIVNSSGHVSFHKDRDEAYARVRELRQQGATGTRRNRAYMARRSIDRSLGRR